MEDEEIVEEEGDETTEDDEESQSDKTDEKKNEDGEDDKPKNRRSEIAQKKHWREKAKQSSAKVQTLEEELAKLRDAVKKPDDEKEAAAQEYIRNQAREVYKQLQLEKAKDEAKELAAFEDQVEEILADNPDIAEEELLDTIEEYDISPQTALRILQRQSKDPKEKKPKMPTPRRAAPSADEGKKVDDSNKSMWQILKEEKEKLLKK